MPRDENGNYLLPSGNPVVTNTAITSTWANDTMSDLANEMQDSLSRSGKGGFEAPVGFIDKEGAVPGLNFIAEPTSGLKRESTEDLRLQVTSTDVWQGTKTGVKVLTPNSGGVLKHPVVEESGKKVMRGVGGTTVLYFYNDTPPTGWTLNTPDANVRELVIGPSGGGEGGTIGGSINPTNLTQELSVSITGTTESTALDHTHDFSGTTSPPSNTAGREAGLNNVATDGHTHTFSGNTGGASVDMNHSHGVGSLAGSGNVSIAPRYARGILATLDA